jgi:hypothetical protein
MRMCKIVINTVLLGLLAILLIGWVHVISELVNRSVGIN